MTATTAAATPATEIKFKEDIVAAANALKPLYVKNMEAGTLALPASAAFESAPEGITAESYHAHKQFIDLRTSAINLAGTELSVDMFAANKELQTITLTAPIQGKDTFEATYKRTGTSRNPANGEVTNYVGSIAVARMNIVSTRSDAEQKAIKKNFRAMAEAAGL